MTAVLCLILWLAVGIWVGYGWGRLVRWSDEASKSNKEHRP